MGMPRHNLILTPEMRMQTLEVKDDKSISVRVKFEIKNATRVVFMHTLPDPEISVRVQSGINVKYLSSKHLSDFQMRRPRSFAVMTIARLSPGDLVEVNFGSRGTKDPRPIITQF